MVGTIAPLVKVAGAGSQAIRANVAFVLTTCAGGGTIGLALGSAGQLLLGPTTPAAAWHTLGVLAFALALVDFGFFGLRSPAIRGSVPREWWVRLGPTLGAAVYGWILG